MRFQVSQVMDAIEQRLTTDVTGAQAVVDLGRIVRNVELDRGRPVSLVRIGMVIDALSRYLVDGGAMLYGVVERALLSESALTSKERMVLGRWADDGLIEVTPAIGDRVVEIADITGLPLIAVPDSQSPQALPYAELGGQYGWLADAAGRLLRLGHRAGVAVLAPMSGSAGEPEVESSTPAIGRAAVPEEPEAEESEAEEPEAEEPEAEETLPLPVAVFANRGVVAVARTRISWHRFPRPEPDGARAALLTRRWRCDEFECPVFGEHRLIGQPVPRLRDSVPTCPRHDQPVVDVGPREVSYPVSIVVDDLPRRRLVVRAGRPLSVGRATDSPDDTDLASVASWLHQAATAWISPVHLRLEAGEEGLIVTDISDNGTVVWQRKGPDDPGATRSLRRESYPLGEWDSVELYTGIELMRGDRRLAAALGRDELESVLVDAPTAAHHQV